MEEPPNINERVGWDNPEDIMRLVSKINYALLQDNEIVLQDTLKMFENIEYTRYYINFSPLILENIAVIPTNYSTNEIILTYKNRNIPIFYHNGNYGHQIELIGGESVHDDNYRYTAVYSIKLSMTDIGCRVSWELEFDDWADAYITRDWMSKFSEKNFHESLRSHYSEMDDAFDKVVELCNQAIQNGETYSFTEFLNLLPHWDEEVAKGAYISTNTLYF